MSVIRTKNRIQFAEDFVLNNGKIGIATDNPQQTLDVAGNISATGLVTASQLSAGLYQGEVRFLDNVFIDGDISIAGTSAIVDTQSLRINDADIILGFTTNQNGDDVSSDTTANHGGIAIASTEGTPLSRVVVAGIETLPATYKKIMWFKSDTFAGVSTDAWMFNYGVSIGNTTNVPNGTRLAAGNVLIGQSDITSVRNINATGIITGGTANFDNYTNLNVDSLNVVGVSTFDEDVVIDANLRVTGVSTFEGNVDLSGSVVSNLDLNGNLDVAGISTFNDTVIFIPDGVAAGTISSTAQKLGGIGTDPYIEVDQDGLDFVGVSTFTDSAIFDSTGSIQIPVGTTAERPGVAVTGQIRYNTDTVSFEGYGPGGAWGSLGGVKDVDGDTYILPETSSGSDEDTLYFYAANNLVGTISSTSQKLGGIGTDPYIEIEPSGLDFVGVSTFADDVTVSGDLSVTGVSTFNDTVTFNPDGSLVGTISSTSQKFGGIEIYPELESTNGNAVLTNNNLSLSSSDGDGSTSREAALSTIAATSGKIYAEISIDTLSKKPIDSL